MNNRPLIATVVITCCLLFSWCANAVGNETKSVLKHGQYTMLLPSQRDGDGKRKNTGKKPPLNTATIRALQARIPMFRALTDREANFFMATLVPDYAWYASDDSLTGEIGLLLLNHGVGEHGDKVLVNSLKPLAEQYPTAFAFGMGMLSSEHIQYAVDDLSGAGVKTIVVIPGTIITNNNSMKRQWDFILNQRDEASYLDIPQLKTEATLLMAPPFNDHPLISAILLDYANEVSRQPGNELVILVGHGPEEIEDNNKDLLIQQKHVDYLKAKGGFADVQTINFQDDALRPVRAANVKKLRKMIKKANRKGVDVIVVGILTSPHSMQATIKTDLRGLKYQFNAKGLIEHPNYLKWLKQNIAEQLAGL